MYFKQKSDQLFASDECLNPVAGLCLFYKSFRLCNFHFVDSDVHCVLGNFHEVCHSSGIILYDICVFFCFAFLFASSSFKRLFDTQNRNLNALPFDSMIHM